MKPAPARTGISLAAIQSQLSSGQKLLFISIGLLSITILTGIFLIQIPWQEKKERLSKDYTDEQGKTDLLSAIEKLQKNSKTLERKHLYTEGISGLTSQITRIASQSGLRIDSITPQPETPYPPYTRIQVEIIANSPLMNVSQFLSAVEQAEPALSVNWVDLSEPPAAASGDSTLFNAPMMPVGSAPLPPLDNSWKRGENIKIRILISAVQRTRGAAS